MSWLDDAACIGSDVDFDHPQDNAEEAKQVCARCPVRFECLQRAVDEDDQSTVRGGMTPDERADWAKRQGLKQHRWNCACDVCDVANGRASHGTPAAARRHYRRDEKPREACREARAAVNRTRKSRAA